MDAEIRNETPAAVWILRGVLRERLFISLNTKDKG